MMSILQELLRLNEHYPEGGDDSTAGWYIVRDKDDEIGAGPFDSKQAAKAKTKFLQWYDEDKYYIEHGWVDEDDKFHVTGT